MTRDVEGSFPMSSLWALIDNQGRIVKAKSGRGYVYASRDQAFHACAGVNQALGTTFRIALLGVIPGEAMEIKPGHAGRRPGDMLRDKAKENP